MAKAKANGHSTIAAKSRSARQCGIGH